MKPFIFGGLILLAMLLTLGREPERTLLAGSQTYGANLFVQGDKGDWCKPSVAVDVLLQRGSSMKEAGLADFFAKAGQVLSVECPGVVQTKIRVFDQTTGEYLYSAIAKKDSDWVVLPAKADLTETLGILSHEYGQLLDKIRHLPHLETRTKAKGFVAAMGAVLLSLGGLALRQRISCAPTQNVGHLYDSSKHGNSGPDAPAPAVPTPRSLVCSKVYEQRLKKALQSAIPKDQESAGELGEAKVLQIIEKCGGGIVFWGLALGIDGQDTECDALVVAPHGLLHVEVKNYRGTWEPVPALYAEADCHARKWHRAEDNNTPKSPVLQADRTRDILNTIVTELVKKPLPVHSVVVMANDSFGFKGLEDDRAKVMALNQFEEFYRSYILAMSPLTTVSRNRIASLLATILDQGQSPAFYDSSLFGSDATEKNTLSLAAAAFKRQLRQQLTEEWGMYQSISKPENIWFGDKRDLTKKYSQA